MAISTVEILTPDPTDVFNILRVDGVRVGLKDGGRECTHRITTADGPEYIQVPARLHVSLAGIQTSLVHKLALRFATDDRIGPPSHARCMSAIET